MPKKNEKGEFGDTFQKFVDNKESPNPPDEKRRRKTPASGKKVPAANKDSSDEEKEAPAPKPATPANRPSRRASANASKSLKEPSDDEVEKEVSEEDMEDMSNSEADSEWDAPNSEEEKPKRGSKRKATATPPAKKGKAATPAKGKAKAGGGRTRRRAPSPSEEDEDENGEGEEGSDSEGESSEGEGGNKENNNQKGSAPQAPVAETPFHKDLVMKDSFFECGKFLVNRADFKLSDYPAVWRMDGKSLIQKYEFMKVEAGKPKYRSISTYAGYNFVNRRLYYPVTTKHISQEKNEHIINFQKGAVDYVFSEGMMASLKSTEGLKETFEVYLQALVTYALESSFFEEVVRDDDRYFLDALDKIENECKTRIEKINTGVYWGEKITSLLVKYPLIHCQVVPMIASEKCHACRERAMTRRVEFRGGDYQPLVLRVEETPSTETPQGICSHCIDVFLVYHRMSHLRLLLFRICDAAVQKLKDEEKSNNEVLESLLNDADWIQKIFREMQVYWAEADAFIASMEKFEAEKKNGEKNKEDEPATNGDKDASSEKDGDKTNGRSSSQASSTDKSN